MLYGARQRSRKAKVPFNITIDDIIVPAICPALGIALRHQIGRGNAKPWSPSLDRIVPELGYTKGNVVVISKRANTIKNNAAPQELEAIASWLRRMLKPQH